jgi:ribosome-binding protein aMBF1 (putative translation factor)
VSAILCKRRSLGYGPVVGASSFLFVTPGPDSLIIRLARTAVKAERSEALGQRIWELRKQRGWRQLDLAVQAGINENYVSDLEVGRKEVCLNTISALAEAFGLTISELMSGV